MHSEAPSSPAVILAASWKGIKVEYGQLSQVGDFDFAMPKQAISVAFAPHDRVTWSVEDGPRQTTALPAGSVFVYGDRELVWHQRHAVSEYAHLVLDPQWLDQLAQEHEVPGNGQLVHRVIVQDPTILQVAQLLTAEVKSAGLAGNLYVESLRNLLAVHLLRNYTEVPNASTGETGAIALWQLQQVKDYIEDNLAENLTIAELAALIPLSQFHFARAFKAAVGEPPHRYVLRRRVEQAKVLLSVTKLPIADIAARVGFVNQSHFSAQFRKLVGATPNQYRSRITGKESGRGTPA
jgi:AraC family transcriptional regulator